MFKMTYSFGSFVLDAENIQGHFQFIQGQITLYDHATLWVWSTCTRVQSHGFDQLDAIKPVSIDYLHSVRPYAMHNAKVKHGIVHKPNIFILMPHVLEVQFEMNFLSSIGVRFKMFKVKSLVNM